MAQQSSITLVRRRANQLRALRDRAYLRLYPTPPPPSDPALERLANTFTRYASTQSTAFDRGGAAPAPAGASLLTRQVERAMAQVLGRAPGRTADSFMSALNGAFPADGRGQIAGTPARSVVSMFGADGTGSANAAAGLAGQISAEQATLYRQATVVGQDALRVLEGLRPFVPEADIDRVEALRALVRAEIGALIDEFGRVDEPRPERVNTFFDTLNGPYGHLVELGQQAFLVRGMATAATVEDESMIAGYDLLRGYVATLRASWDNYNQPGRSLNYPLFTDRLARASVLLPVIAEGNNNLMAALDSIGFTEAERRSQAAKFTTMSRLPNPRPALPNMTVNDLTEWLDRFSNIEAPAALGDSGQYGLQYVADQADRLFWVFVAILTYTRGLVTPAPSAAAIVTQALVHERVAWALDDLIGQLKSLADEAA